MPDQSSIQFHFLEPAWLLALLPLALLLWLTVRREAVDTPWRRIIDARLQPLLMDGGKSAHSRMPFWLLGIGWLITVLALANPVWERQPQPLMQTNAARVIVLDLSRSMLAQDLKPTRIERARFKVEDILAEDEEGLTGLVVFAGDAFTVTPLTRDTETIRSQLRALEPAIMPSQGSRADLGLLQALELLQQAGVVQGQIILIADGVEGDLATEAAERIAQAGHTVSVLGVGTAEGAPLYDARGNMLSDRSGKPVIVGLDTASLRRVALAGSGVYRQMTTANSDIDALLVSGNRQGESETVDDMRAEKWKERGPYLTLLLLPLAALAFRRGWLFSMVLAILFVSPSHDAMAFEWRDLWQRADQQAAEALQQQDYEKVPDITGDPSLLGSAAYKRGDYRQALEQFDRLDGADAAYNRGNALARLGKYREAIEAYDDAIEQQPGMDDAIFNKAAIEELLKQREQEEEQTDEQQERQEQGNRAQQSEEQQDRQQPSSEQQEQQNQQADSGEGSSEQEAQSQQADSQQQSAQQQNQQSQQAQNGQESEQQQGEQGQAQQEGTEENTQSAQQQAEQTTGAGDESDENQFAKANEALDENRNDDGSDEEQFEGESSSEQQRQPETAQQQERQPGSDEQQQAMAEELSSEEEMAAQQWLRRIPDDPGGLLRRKFLYQYRERGWSESPGGQGY
ncbi:MAG: VWA domain-containing protein [Gammaproteobacteria bacterium]|jgi:Ca-activated chloride channel family protein